MTIATEWPHIKGMVFRAFFASTVVTTLSAGLIYMGTTGVAAFMPASRYLQIESIVIDPDTWCVTSTRWVNHTIRASWAAELIDVGDTSNEECAGGGFAPIQPKSDGRVVLPFDKYFGSTCKPDTDREWQLKVVYEFTKHGAQKIADRLSAPVFLRGEPAVRCH